GLHGSTGTTQLSQPVGLALADDSLFVADLGGSRIWIEDLASGDVAFATHPDLSAEAASHLAVHDGELYVPSYVGNHILVFGQDGVYRRDIPAQVGTAAGPYAFGRGIDVAPDGTIYAISAAPIKVVVLPPGGEPWVLGEQAGSPGPGQYVSPIDLAVAPDGSVYVVDFGNSRVLRYGADGQHLATFGGVGSDPGEFLYPYGIGVDPAGLVYVSDSGNQRVQVFQASGSYLTSVGPPSGDPGSFVNGQPAGIAFDGDGRLYVANGAAAAPSPNPIHRVVSFDPVMAPWSSPYLQGGAPAIGATLSVQRGVWPGGVPVSVQWLRGGAPVPGATGNSYAVTGADAGRSVGVRVTGAFGSRGSVPVTLTAGTTPKAQSTVRVAKTKAKAGTKPRVKVTVSGPAGAPLTGTVTIKRGSKVLATKTLTTSHRGTVTVSVPKHKVGTYRLTATFAGNVSLLPSSSASAKLTVAKAKPKVSLKLVKKKVARSAKAKVKVTVKVAGMSKPTGTLRLYDGKKRITTVTLKAKHRGTVSVRLPRLATGKHKLKVVYSGTKQIAKRTSKVAVLRVTR
ncbi:MAG: Ig-like domain repeat protein, partial [Actinomycetota bacterium]|nr:Ig-like domain repeat protein [Actinomycetota bacterium]